MKNKTTGYIIIGIAVLIGFIISAFNKALTEIVNTTCSHGSECAMWTSIRFQTNISLGIMIVIILTGLYLIFFAKEKSKEKSKELDLSKFSEDEKILLNEILNAEGTIFQSELTEKTNMNKVKITRILDRLEGKGKIERKRRGMTNVVILKHN
ncbi:MarR family transcriptional regulator [Candidatus Woesearchaeota archaeon]|jgi:uncharacterized membrane protein|nr:MarR family transcriptional regulator [Candidatus Woesearchaeota archaeon]MBT6995336.1 MarR family transcriptional regulator [Candidatus Woesearchaeota archaeon]MBT7238041.1 MarR family transcriptional regulator [Candidatus Woesearchaeota archaeon]